MVEILHARTERDRGVARRAVGAGAKPRAFGVLDGPGDLSQDVDGHLAKTGFGES
jgi:hypothetical protein